MRLTLICIALLALVLKMTSGARILGLFPFGGKSHSIVINAVVSELSKRGHKVHHLNEFLIYQIITILCCF